MELTTRPELINRPETHFLYLEKSGNIKDIAMPAWTDMFPLIDGKFDKLEIKEYLGMTQVTGKDQANVLYDAGIALSNEPKEIPTGLKYKKVPEGKYARFLLTGSYKGIHSAFDKAFGILADSKITLRDAECVENYLNDPNQTPETELKTEILIPIQ